MDIALDMDDFGMIAQAQSLEIGEWEDLVHLIMLLNGSWESREYRLERVPNKTGMWLFVEDILNEDEYSCGIIEKDGKKAIAFSPAVHAMVMNAYQEYVDEFGDPMDA